MLIAKPAGPLAPYNAYIGQWVQFAFFNLSVCHRCVQASTIACGAAVLDRLRTQWNDFSDQQVSEANNFDSFGSSQVFAFGSKGFTRYQGSEFVWHRGWTNDDAWSETPEGSTPDPSSRHDDVVGTLPPDSTGLCPLEACLHPPPPHHHHLQVFSVRMIQAHWKSDRHCRRFLLRH